MMLAAAAAMACSMEADSAFDNGARAPNCAADDTECKSKGSNPDGGELDGNDAKGAPGAPTSDGVILVHAASFPAFRLCFENDMDRLPQPDSSVMPQANVVGVEVGSLVRIDPLPKGPGKIFVLRELPTRTGKKCNEYIQRTSEGVDKGLAQETIDYIIADQELHEPIGVKQAEVLAISGCGTKLMLAKLDGVTSSSVDSTSCGKDWNGENGHLIASVVPLDTTDEIPTKSSIPIRLYNMAPAVDVLKGTLSVSFGEAGKQAPLRTNATFEAGIPQTLSVNQDKIESYGEQAFTVTATLPSGDPVTVNQTLADVQQLSSPNDNPTTYYYSASNYALLVLGDPSHRATRGDGTPNPAFNPRRALHILAVPVLDPTKADAGADAGADAETP